MYVQAKQLQEQAHSLGTPRYMRPLELLKTAARRITHGGGDGCGRFHKTIHINLDTGMLPSHASYSNASEWCQAFISAVAALGSMVIMVW